VTGPRWHDDVPDRTGDPRIKRAPLHRAAISVMKRATLGRSYQFMRVVSVNRRLFRPFLAYNMRLMPFGTLDRAESEAVILRTAAACGSRYEWTQHRALGRRAGLTDEQIELITNYPGDERLGALRLLMTATAEVLEHRVLSDETWRALSLRYEPAQILEIVMLAGNYAMLAGALNSFGVPLETAWRG
jgi:alkylhydroperoxidase family enzyme